MKNTIKVFIFIIVCIPFFIYPLAYDNAAYAAQKGEWKNAHERLNNILINAPDRADVLYDVGVAAYNLGNFPQAAAYCARSAECTDDNDLRSRAYFNAGNASVAHKELEAALDYYEKVLALAPTHEYARHNRDRVKQMLEEQKKEEQQQQKDDKKDDKKDEQNKDQEKNGQQDKQEQSNGDDNNQDGDQEQGNNGSDKKSEGEQGDTSESAGKDTHGKDQGNKEKNQNKSTENKERDGKDKSQEKSHDKNDKRDTQQGDEHKDTPEKQLNGSDNASVPSDEGQEQGNVGSAQHTLQENFEQKIQDPWLLELLKNQEERDKVMNKQLMEAKIRQHGGKNGQNCW